MKTFGGWGKEIENVSFNCKTAFISFKLQMNMGPQAGKEEICNVCRGSVVFEPMSTWGFDEFQGDIKRLEGWSGDPLAMRKVS